MQIAQLSFFRFYFMAVLITILVGCDKGSDTPAAKTEAQLIGSGKAWKFSKATSGGVDVSALVDACLKDNLITMNDASPTKTGNLNEGALKCNASDPQQVDFTWTFDGTTKLLTISPTLQLPIAKLSNIRGFNFFWWRFVYYKFDLLKGF